MKRTIAASNTLPIAKRMWPVLKSIMPTYTWPECLAFAARERRFYNERGGYGAISDHFLLAAHALGLEV
jgi:hypothetical protein